MYIGTIRFVILLMLLFVIYVYSMVYTISYILYGETMGIVHKNIASLLLHLLLLLFVIYDGIGTSMKRQ